MEIEAKFQVPNEDVFDSLLILPALGGFVLGPVERITLKDLYLDTADGRFLAAGYACRLRRQNGQFVATLKGLGGATGTVHRREEWEVLLAEPLPPAGWPASAVRDLALELVGDEPLLPLFEIEQERHGRSVQDGQRLVAELSLDRVRMCREGEAPYSGLELEIELAPEGSEDDLARLAAEIEATWGLAPVEGSKFERALRAVHPALVVGGPETVMAPHLTADERAIVEALAGERAVLARRARLLLAWDAGASVAEMIERSGLSPRRARHWRHLFRSRRLGIFPRRALALAWREGQRTTSPASEPADKAAPSHALGLAVEAVPVAVAEPPAAPLLRVLPKRPGIEPDDPMSEAGRKLLRFHFQRMLYYEPGTRQGEDTEALHDMRVATRRMRAAFRVFGAHYHADKIAPFLRDLRRTGRALGEVRDLDVFRERVQAYLATLSEPDGDGLRAFLSELESQREAGRERLLGYLDGERYQRFVERFGAFTETDGLFSLPVRPDGVEPRPYRVRHVAPMVIYEWLAAVRAYDEWVTVPDPSLTRLHALRIACKRLRYALEFFQEVLGPETRAILKQVVTAQDHLGLVQDGLVASGILRDFLVWGTWGRAAPDRPPRGTEPPLIAPGVATYLAVRQSEVRQLVATFPTVWAGITGREFSQGLAAAVAVL